MEGIIISSIISSGAVITAAIFKFTPARNLNGNTPITKDMCDTKYTEVKEDILELKADIRSIKEDTKVLPLLINELKRGNRR